MGGGGGGGGGGTLAHAFYPPDGRSHVDESETFRDGGTYWMNNNLLEVKM